MTTETIITNARWTYFVWAWERIAKAINLPYSVTLWSSHPDEENDDCNNGEDYATREAAIAAYRETVMFPTEGLAKHTGVWAFVMIDGPDVHEVTAQPDRNALKRYRRELALDDDAARSERAMTVRV